MKGIINFIDNNYGLLDNHIFLSICWNMIYFANKANNFDVSYLSELKIPSSYCFSYLGNELDLFYINNDTLNFIRYNPNLVTKRGHLELYNLIYYSELKCDNQAAFFFKPYIEISNVNNKINYIGKHKLYNITFDCNLFNTRVMNKNLISIAFQGNHPFFIDHFDSDILKMRAITHKPPTGTICHRIGTTPSYIMDFTYNVPKSFILEMDVYKNKDENDTLEYDSLNSIIHNSNLVNMPNKEINTLKLAINCNFNYGKPLVKFNDCIVDNNINYLEHFNELQNKLKYNNRLMFDYYKEKPISDLSVKIGNRWK